MAAPNSNGSRPEPSTAADVIDVVRRRPRHALALGGFGPLVAGLVLFVLMLLLAPTVAPERVVERPVSHPTATTTTAVTTTTVGP